MAEDEKKDTLGEGSIDTASSGSEDAKTEDRVEIVVAEGGPGQTNSQHAFC